MIRTSPALRAQIPFRYGGHDYLVPPAVDWMHEAEALLAENRLAAAIRLVLGHEQYAAFRATKPNVADAAALMSSLGAAFSVTTSKRLPHSPRRRLGRGRR
jgi:hypothetical protein